jgi:hypothetical protein
MFARIGLLVGCPIGLFVGVGSQESSLWSNSIQSPVVVHLCLHMIDFPLYLIAQPIFVNVTSHPTLQRLMTNMSGWEAMCCRMCACHVHSDSWSSRRVHVCVVQILSPFGSFEKSGVFPSFLLLKGAVVMRKWLLVPESMITHLCMFLSVRMTVLRRDGVGIELVCVDITEAYCLIENYYTNCLPLSIRSCHNHSTIEGA